MKSHKTGRRCIHGILLIACMMLVIDAAFCQMPGGQLVIESDDGAQIECPLTHTNVEANIVGFVCRTTVWQTFENAMDETIEATYLFPLPADAAVDDMKMIVGDRTIRGVIMPKPEARHTYEKAKKEGKTASLLEQERPNIFTQSVANIPPGEYVIVQISYLETLDYEDGIYEYSFPMVVGPRYVPSPEIIRETSGETRIEAVEDAAKIVAPPLPPETRAGHDVAIRVYIDAGMEIGEVTSVLHDVDIERALPNLTIVNLAERDEIPNRDFILRYRTVTDEITDAFMTYADDRGAFFTMILQPPLKVAPDEAVPKEMIFVIDRSGSMSGFPIEKAKETMRYCIERMNPRDTFNLLSFSGGLGQCFDEPVFNTPLTREEAFKYLNDLYGSGGTEMMPAIKAALGGAHDPERVRIVCFMTDGYIGNDYSIIDEVKKHVGTSRVFSFGIGNSVNRFLLDNMAREGRGEVEYVTLKSQSADAAQRFFERINAPVMTDIEIDWGTLEVSDVFPRHIPDLFSAKPITIHGRLEGVGDGAITLRGRTGGGLYEETIEVSPARAEAAYESLASLWSRAKVKDLMHADLRNAYGSNVTDDIKAQIVDLALRFRLMTQFTSFVAVEERIVNEGGVSKSVAVPLHAPSGMSGLGVATATNDTLLLLLGFLACAVGAFFLFMHVLLRRKFSGAV